MQPDVFSTTIPYGHHAEINKISGAQAAAQNIEEYSLTNGNTF